MKTAFFPQNVVLVFDYDGTLVPLKKTPEEARLDAEGKKLLQELRRRGFPVILLSGRDLPSLRKASRLKRFPMIGSHGFEVANLPGVVLSNLSLRRRVARNVRVLRRKTYRLFQDPGLFVEKKPYSITLHYRNASLNPQQENALKEKFKRLFSKAASKKIFDFQEGKKIIEAKPRGFSKAKALRAIKRAFPGRILFYAGDDLTDLEGLRGLGKKDFFAGVGARIPRHRCDIHLKTPAAFRHFIRRAFLHGKTS